MIIIITADLSSRNISEPEVKILGGPDMYVDTGSIINLTCIITWTPEPPRLTLWHHNLSSISFRGPRPGVSLLVDKSEVTTVQLIMMSARYSDSGLYTCSPDNGPQAQLTLHVLTGQSQEPEAIGPTWPGWCYQWILKTKTRNLFSSD